LPGAKSSNFSLECIRAAHPGREDLATEPNSHGKVVKVTLSNVSGSVLCLCSWSQHLHCQKCTLHSDIIRLKGIAEVQVLRGAKLVASGPMDSWFGHMIHASCAIAQCFVKALLLFCIVSLSQCHDAFQQGFSDRDINVVGVVAVRNAEHLVAPFLRLLSPFVNFTIVLDDSSSDRTVSVIESVSKETKVRQVLLKSSHWNRSETTDRNELLLAGSALI
jgi:hypothetical protein